MALRSLSRVLNGSTKKSLLGLTGEGSSIAFVPRSARDSSVRGLAVAARQEAAAEEGTGESLERPNSRGYPVSRRGSGRQLRTIDPLLELWDPFGTNRSVTEMLNAVDRMIDAPFFRSSGAAIPSRMRLPSDLIEDSDSYRLRIDMPGLSKEEVKVTVEDGQLVIKGEHNAEEKSEDRWTSRSYNTRLTLPDHVKVEDVKAELKNGVLRVVMPKCKEDPKKNPIPIEVH
ncbi:hypothetical protein M758_4G092800 [Ceratodon purpureus]|nr:hypothetical protein M758_4G092800 [Ceratodon purpureus]